MPVDCVQKWVALPIFLVNSDHFGAKALYKTGQKDEEIGPKSCNSETFPGKFQVTSGFRGKPEIKFSIQLLIDFPHTSARHIQLDFVQLLSNPSLYENAMMDRRFQQMGSCVFVQVDS